MRTDAWMYSGRWVADCPRHGCGNVEVLVGVGHPFACSECSLVCNVNWPQDFLVIEDALSRRPVPHTRNWFPRNHPLAVKAGIPHGQSVQDLLIESFEHGVF